jgi:hypothetical protein
VTPEAFVAGLAASVRRSAEGEAEYFAAPRSEYPPAHLARFSAWFQRLSPADQEIAREVIRYAAEGSLFGLLIYLDNIVSLTESGGAFELWYTARNGARVQLNDPDGDLLTDLFNIAEPGATAHRAGGER